MPECVICKGYTTSKCSRCGTNYYCSRECQLKDWPSHKPICLKPVDFESLIPAIWKTYLSSEGHPWPIQKFGGTKTIKGKKYWFFELEKRQTVIGGNHKDFWTTNSCVEKGSSRCMTEAEFWVYETINSCQIFSVPLAILLSEFKKQKKCLRIRGEKVSDIRIIETHVETEFTDQMLCFEKQPTTLPLHKWDCDKGVTKEDNHTVLGLWTEGKKVWSVDFAAAQYEIFTQEVGHYIHIEELPSLRELAIGETLDPMLALCYSQGRVVARSPLGKSSYASILCTYDPQEKKAKICADPHYAKAFNIMYKALSKNLE